MEQPAGVCELAADALFVLRQRHYDITDKIQFYTQRAFCESRTQTLLPTPTTAIFGWEANVPYNAATDSPINPALINPTTSQATLQPICRSFAANPTSSNPNWNPGFIPIGTKGAQHPVPWQLALLLDSRGTNGIPPPALPGRCSAAPRLLSGDFGHAVLERRTSSWHVGLSTPSSALRSARRVDTSSSWQIETGFRFPLFGDWTGDVYYSRGQSLNYESGFGNDSLQRFRAVIQSPGYGQGQSFQGNANGANLNFRHLGAHAPAPAASTARSSADDVAPSADCQNAISAVLQTMTAMQQDIVEANF